MRLNITHYNRAFLMTLSILIVKISVSQTILVNNPNKYKIDQALVILEKYEPDIFYTIINKSFIQLGEIPGEPDINFNILDEVNEKQNLWIMLTVNLVNYSSVNEIASLILHEAMHLRYRLTIPRDSPNYSFKQREKIEHIAIYNYEILFLRKIGSPEHHIRGRKEVMRKLSIPILI